MPLVSLARLFSRKTSLYLNREVADASVRGASLALVKDGVEKRLPLSSLRRLVLLGRVNLPMDLLYDLARADVPVEWQDQHGRTVALLWPINRDCDSLALKQAAFNASSGAFELARALILAKADNCHEILRRRIEHGPDWAALRKGIAHADNPDSLRGHEGAAASAYFEPGAGFCIISNGREGILSRRPIQLMRSSISAIPCCATA